VGCSCESCVLRGLRQTFLEVIAAVLEHEGRRVGLVAHDHAAHVGVRARAAAGGRGESQSSQPRKRPCARCAAVRTTHGGCSGTAAPSQPHRRSEVYVMIVYLRNKTRNDANTTRASAQRCGLRSGTVASTSWRCDQRLAPAPAHGRRVPVGGEQLNLQLVGRVVLAEPVVVVEITLLPSIDI
jgi:hypothetical protein